jgi:ribonuclease HI
LDFINIYTTGSSVGSPGPGGYGYVIIINGEEHEQSFGGFALTTNIRMELMAPIIALEGLRGIPNPIIVHSGYSYLANAINKGWLEKWKKRRWNNTQGFKIQDVDLWRRLFIAMKGLDVTFRWAAAHSRMPLSKLADTLANEAAHQPDLPADKGYQNKV